MTLLPTDARLARRATEGDERAFAAIFRRYHQELYRFCLSILRRPEDAQDALQNTMVKALRSLPGEEREIELKPWLYRVAHNESIEVLRKRREGVEFDAERMSAAGEPAETAALRERLRKLFDDLELLPERQRSGLIMRELGGLSFDQIGETFETSPAVARQTVYEARLNLRQLEAGREMSCDQVTRQLSEADGRVTRRRDVQAHLRACRECREFGEAIEGRRRDLVAIAPLPVAAAGSILHGVLGGNAASASGGLAGGASGAVGAGAGKAIATSAAVKTIAAVAVVATIGVTAADRGGLIDAGLPGGKGAARTATGDAGGADEHAGAVLGNQRLRSDGPREGAARHRRQAVVATAGIRASQGRKDGAPLPTTAANDTPPGTPETLPEASRHGQETAATHKASRGTNPGQNHRHTPVTGPRNSHSDAAPNGGGPPKHATGGQAKQGPATAGAGPAEATPAAPPARGKGPSQRQEKAVEAPVPPVPDEGSSDGAPESPSP